VPTRLVHAEKALSPPLARTFFDTLGAPKQMQWLASQGADFDPAPHHAEEVLSDLRAMVAAIRKAVA
jgi:hypothetical protein